MFDIDSKIFNERTKELEKENKQLWKEVKSLKDKIDRIIKQDIKTVTWKGVKRLEEKLNEENEKGVI